MTLLPAVRGFDGVEMLLLSLKKRTGAKVSKLFEKPFHQTEYMLMLNLRLDGSGLPLMFGRGEHGVLKACDSCTWGPA